eukprot:2009925-Rhodomonas_salina.1
MWEQENGTRRDVTPGHSELTQRLERLRVVGAEIDAEHAAQQADSSEWEEMGGADRYAFPRAVESVG